MAILNIKVPDIGEGVTEAEVVEWDVKVGDSVSEDQTLGSIMTDKAAVEVPSPSNGTVTELCASIGDVIAVGSVLVKLEVEGVGNDVEPTEASQKAGVEKSVELEEKHKKETESHAASEALPAARPRTKRDNNEPGHRPLAAPSVRQYARDNGVELKFVSGTGPGGRILRPDIDNYLDGVNTLPSKAGLSTNTRIDEIPLIGMRRQIAERMQRAKQRIPHFSYVEEVDVTSLEELRAELNRDKADDQPRLTVLPFIIKSITRAVKQFPQMNARFDDDENVIRQFGGIHVGIATQTDNGLLVPVLRHAEALDIWEISKEVRRLADAARNATAARDEITNSTITITSLGALGGIVTTPVINYPEVAILGVNKIVTRPVWLDDGVVPRQIMNLSSSFDHRVVDGWDAAHFIQRIRTMLEQPTLMFMEDA